MKLIAACAFGLEAIVKRELMALRYEARVLTPGRIGFEGDWAAVCEANIWLRTADRVLLEVQRFDAPDFDALFETVKAFDWSQYIPADGQFPVIGRSRLSQLTSVPAIQRTVKKALVESLRKYHKTETLGESAATYKVEVALLKDEAVLTLDTTGPSLHKRGYRKLTAPAPLKETLAAALVNLSVWNASRVLSDPFCGSGTIAIEAALQARNIAPGLKRAFASSDWPVIHQRVWEDARKHAKAQRKLDLPLNILASDRDPDVLSLAQYHARQAGVSDAIRFEEQPFDQFSSDQEYGCIVTNPPYGERLEEQDRLVGLYESFPEVLQRLPTWSLFLITNMPRFERIVQKQATRRRKLFNGRIECCYYQFLGPKPPSMIRQRPAEADETESEVEAVSPEELTLDAVAAGPVLPSQETWQTKIPVEIIESPKATPPIAAPMDLADRDLQTPLPVDSTKVDPPAKPEIQPVFGSINAKDREQAGLFKNRLVKRARHLRRWPTKRGISCFRLYERDIPEIPLVVDRYENYLHITEYERPHDRDLARHRAWLDLMRETASESLSVPLENTFLKQRRKGDSTGQYHKLDDAGRRVVVHEGGLKFLVNFSDYVDTGLFLDHRVARKMVMDEANGKRMLNLFAYTGAFSVYAAAGGARSTTTVDLSRTYLDWAGENFQINGLESRQHQFVASDTIDFLETTASQRKQFDLVVCDPPTYSNSKRTENDWDVQHGYVSIFEHLKKIVAPQGVVYFSTNFRRFKFDEDFIRSLGFDFREISKTTVPEDFRNRRIHRCWRLVRG